MVDEVLGRGRSVEMEIPNVVLEDFVVSHGRKVHCVFVRQAVRGSVIVFSQCA